MLDERIGTQNLLAVWDAHAVGLRGIVGEADWRAVRVVVDGFVAGFGVGVAVGGVSCDDGGGWV